MVEQARRLRPLGLATGTSGNLSERGTGGMWITPSGIDYDQLQPEDIVFVDDAGRWQHALAPSSEWRMHQAVYQARPEAGAVVHGHPTYATVLAIRGLEIPPLHYMIAAAGGPTIRCAPYHTYGTAELSAAAVAALDGRKACLLANHGLLAFERDLERAMWLAREVETLAQQYVMCLPLGGPVLLDEAEIARVVEKFAHYGQRAR
ncbi:class II aldolase/adducin family protein [Aquincola sp. S2]|uniref:Class II aldolase/adducin family protein n=1 Tax=Pseudaquabacterium terrae TaxID=2732868 RepID=A0ABX2EKZ7_9BURK|nr:class II aldolase/adducin family protein [Aquabacterium terrae]NRF69317.1 class II aldolase/adducin family protein [Aquabacterium terrae]